MGQIENKQQDSKIKANHAKIYLSITNRQNSIELSNHYLIHPKLIEHCVLIMSIKNTKSEHNTLTGRDGNFT